jgi:hypothetical protein
MLLDYPIDAPLLNSCLTSKVSIFYKEEACRPKEIKPHRAPFLPLLHSPIPTGAVLVGRWSHTPLPRFSWQRLS